MKRRQITRPTILHRTASVRARGDDAPGFDGHASTFWAVDDYLTAMAPGAFRKTIGERGSRIPVLWQHYADTPIGKPTRLAEDQTGLEFEADVVTETRAGAEAMELLRAGVPLGMSFGFQTIKSRSYEEADESFLDWSSAPPYAQNGAADWVRDELRIIQEVRLWEISLVTFPANEAAAISAVREQDALTHLLASIRSGDPLSDEQSRQIEHLIAAWNDRAGAGTTTPLADPKRRSLHAEFEFICAGLIPAGV